MKIGYIILCHTEPTLVKRIANKITEGTENIAIIHVDKKVDDLPFKNKLKDNKQVIFCENRKKIFWGGYSSIEATIEALKIALSFNCSRYVLLQGRDYPIHSNEYIENFFKKNKDVEFLRAYNITKSKRKINYMKCHGFHMFDNINRSKISISTVIAKMFSLLNRVGIKYRKGYYRDYATNDRYDIYWGWGHFALTKSCVEYIITINEEKQDFNKYFKNIFPADETYLQTIVYNSPFAHKTVDKGPVDEENNKTVESMLNLTYFEYPNQVKIMNHIDEIEKIDATRYLFVRKISTEESFLNQVDDYIKQREANY